MSNPGMPESESTESFDQIFSQYEHDQSRKAHDGGRQIEGTVIAISVDSVFVDIGFKSEGMLPLSIFQGAGEDVKIGDKLLVSVKGRDTEGYYQLSRFKVEQPKDWSALEQAFASKTAISGTVTGVIKGGFSVDIGVRAFMPASRSGVRDAAEMEKLVGQEVRCLIIKLDAAEEDVVVDRRVLAEEEERSTKERRFSELAEGDTVHGTVRSIADYGAFVDLGGVDGLLHVSDIAWSHIKNPADVLSVGQEVQVKVLKVSNDAGKRRISVGLKQLLPQPWDSAASKYKVGDRVRGAVTRLTDFGAFVELEPGIEGLIHVSEMSWVKKVRKPSDLLKPGENVETVILAVNAGEHRISLGLKQTLGDPWVDVTKNMPIGAQVEGPVTSFTKFGAFVQIAEGVEGMVHISEIIADKHLNHPQDALKLGQRVKAQVLLIDPEKRQLRLSIKQLVPSSLDEYLAEHKIGDVVTGRLVDTTNEQARVQLGEGIQATCKIKAGQSTKTEDPAATSNTDLSSLTSMLQARWKSGPSAATQKKEALQSGQVRSFKISKIDPASKQIELELQY